MIPNYIDEDNADNYDNIIQYGDISEGQSVWTAEAALGRSAMLGKLIILGASTYSLSVFAFGIRARHLIHRES